MAMAMYELFDYVEKHTTAWAHRGVTGALSFVDLPLLSSQYCQYME
jgi:hypothetical protein